VLDNTSGCSSVSASQVTINPVAGQPVITLTSSTNVTCNGDADGSLDVSVAGGSSPYTYSWSPNVGSGPSVSNLSGGSYDITVTDNLGCSSTETFTVNEPGVLAVNGIATNVNCGTNDGSISTSVSGGTSTYTYSWTPNGETTSSLSGLVGGSYGVTVTDANGCTATENYTIIIVGSLPIVIDPDYSEVTAGTVIQYNTTGGTTYTWTPSTGLSCSDCPNPSVTATQDITYYVTATDPNGCTGSDSTVIVLKLPCGELFVPTIFSPNGTGPQANNELCVFGTASCIKELLFQVYDRWGEKVFETTDISKCWNGKFKDKDMNSGIYVYRLYAELTTGEIIDVSGNSTLVR
jgi:gliding motility-associated-like protein